MDANTIAFGWQRLKEGSLSSGGWVSAGDIHLSNALNFDLESVARTTDATTGNTKLIRDYGASVTLRVFSIVRSNLQSAAKWRIIASDNADLSSPTHDTGWIDCWPTQWPTGALFTSHSNYSTRKLTNAQIAARRWDVVYVAPADWSARYWGIQFDDTTNTQGFVQFGCLVMVPVYQPSGNMSYGADWGRDTTSVPGEADSGTIYVKRKPIRRVLAVVFDALREVEGVSVMMDMLDDLGLDQPVYVVFDPTDTDLLQRRSFFGQVKALSSMRYANVDQGQIPITLIERL